MRRCAVLVGVDGSASSEAAVALAAAEATARRVPLTLLHAWKPPNTAFPAAPWSRPAQLPERSELEAAARTTLARCAGGVRRTEPDLDVEPRLVEAAPDEALLEASRSAALLVMGGVDRGRHELGWLGPVPLHVTGRTACPVIVVPSGVRPDGPVVVGIDDVGASAAAVAFAFEQAERARRGVLAVHAFSSSTWTGSGIDETRLAQLHELARAALSEALAGWGEKHPDVRVTELVTTEHPVRALRCAAADASLLVLGSHGRSPVARHVLGPISATLLRVSPCPVAVATEND